MLLHFSLLHSPVCAFLFVFAGSGCLLCITVSLLLFFLACFFFAFCCVLFPELLCQTSSSVCVFLFVFAGSGCWLCVTVSLLLFFLACLLSCVSCILLPRAALSDPAPKRKKYLLAAGKTLVGSDKNTGNVKNIFRREFFSKRKRKKYLRSEKNTGNGKYTRSKQKKSRKREKYRVEAGTEVPEAGKILFETGKIRSPFGDTACFSLSISEALSSQSACFQHHLRALADQGKVFLQILNICRCAPQEGTVIFLNDVEKNQEPKLTASNK